MATRAEVYAAIDGERDYQDAGRGNAKRLPPHEGEPLTAGEIIACMQKCLNDALDAWYKPGGSTAAQEYIRKVAALGVQSMERYGAPVRK